MGTHLLRKHLLLGQVKRDVKSVKETSQGARSRVSEEGALLER